MFSLSEVFFGADRSSVSQSVNSSCAQGVVPSQGRAVTIILCTTRVQRQKPFWLRQGAQGVAISVSMFGFCSVSSFWIRIYFDTIYVELYSIQKAYSLHTEEAYYMILHRV